MKFQTELKESDKTVQFLDDAKEAERKRKTRRAFWVGGTSGLITFIFLFTEDWIGAIMGSIVITFLVTGSMLPEGDTWQS